MTFESFINVFVNCNIYHPRRFSLGKWDTWCYPQQSVAYKALYASVEYNYIHCWSNVQWLLLGCNRQHTVIGSDNSLVPNMPHANTVYPKKYAHGFCFAVLCCGYTLTDFPISIRLTSLALWQSNDCPSASKATLMNMDKYFMWIHYERMHNHNKTKHNKTVCIFLGIYCISTSLLTHMCHSASVS